MEDRMDARLRERLKQAQQGKEPEGKEEKGPNFLKYVGVGLVLLMLGGIGVWSIFRGQRGPTIYLQVRTRPPLKDTLIFAQIKEAKEGEEGKQRTDLSVEVYSPESSERESGKRFSTWEGVMGKPVKLPPGVYRVAFKSNPTVPILYIPLTASMNGEVVDTLAEICLVAMAPPSEAVVYLDQRVVECRSNPCPFPRNGTLKILRSGKSSYMVDINGKRQLSIVDLRKCDGEIHLRFPGQKTPSMDASPGDISSPITDGMTDGSAESPEPPKSASSHQKKRTVLPSLTQVLQQGDVEGLARLLDAGKVRLSYRDQEGRTLLHLAASLGHQRMIRFLVNEGLAVDIRDARGNTPLHYAAYYGQVEAIQTLLALGADLHAQNTHRGETPLFSAIRGKKVQAVRYLLQRGARVDVRNAFGMTPIHVVACCAIGAVDILDLLVAAGADLYAQTTRPYRNVPTGATALDVAEAFGNSLVAQALERQGVRRGTYGGSP